MYGSYLSYPTCNYIDGIALEVSTYTHILLLQVNIRTHVFLFMDFCEFLGRCMYII